MRTATPRHARPWDGEPVSLYKRGNVWWSRIEVNGETLQRTTRCRAKKDARDVEAAWRVAHAKGAVGIYDHSKAPTLVKFGPRFLEYIPAHVSARTAIFYRDAWKQIVAYVPLAVTQLFRIDQNLIAQFTQARLDEGMLPATVNGNLRTLRHALHLAADWRLIQKAPKIKLLPGERQREYIISEEVLAKFIKRARPGMKRLLPFLIDVGLRISECCNLTWETVSLEPKEGAERGWVYIPKGKSKYAKRYVPLTTRAASILKLQKAESRSQWVWTSCTARRKLSRTWPSAQFKALRDEFNLPWDCVLHSCRHTFCTRLGESGCDAFTIQKLAGHSSIVISQRYVHPTPARLEKAISALEASTESYTAV